MSFQVFFHVCAIPRTKVTRGGKGIELNVTGCESHRVPGVEVLLLFCYLKEEEEEEAGQKMFGKVIALSL